eukprot:TRINITY_DN28266_c0_g1_i1.p1 TRINITY_DN28266_c0_g1~~TRINITY_DN28266_c0_g1_i1.p1  ORF type:complete len:413 (+),score=121.81 TRINITY_DN28266_c0_g1_i1:100-1239(+)
MVEIVDHRQSGGSRPPAPAPAATSPASRSPIPYLLGRPLLRPCDVPTVLAMLQTTGSGADPEDPDAEPYAPLTEDEIRRMATPSALRQLRRSSAVQRCADRVPAMALPSDSGGEEQAETAAAGEAAPQQPAEESAELSGPAALARFLSPTALEDVMAQLSDVGTAVHARGADVTSMEKPPPAAPARELTPAEREAHAAAAAAAQQQIFGTARCGLTEQELVQLSHIVGIERPRSDAVVDTIEEELALERWEARSEAERWRGVNLNRCFVDGDVSAYPYLRSPTGLRPGTLPWAQPPVTMSISDGSDIAEFPLTQAATETPDDFRRDLSLLSTYQTQLALIEQRQRERKYDAERRERQCRHSGPHVVATSAGDTAAWVPP